MNLEDVAVGKIFLNKDGVTFRYIFKMDEDYKRWVYIESHDLGEKHDGNFMYDCCYCHHQRLHMFRKDVIREATPEEYGKLQPLVEQYNIDVENSTKTDRQLMLESFSEAELHGELERRKAKMRPCEKEKIC